MRCQKSHWPEHKVLCQAISHLSEASPNKSKDFIDPACVSHLTPSEHEKVVGLIGKKCMVKCLLNDCECEMLWNTGAQVSIISDAFFPRYLGQMAIKQLSELRMYVCLLITLTCSLKAGLRRAQLNGIDRMHFEYRQTVMNEPGAQQPRQMFLTWVKARSQHR